MFVFIVLKSVPGTYQGEQPSIKHEDKTMQKTLTYANNCVINFNDVTRVGDASEIFTRPGSGEIRPSFGADKFVIHDDLDDFAKKHPDSLWDAVGYADARWYDADDEAWIGKGWLLRATSDRAFSTKAPAKGQRRWWHNAADEETLTDADLSGQGWFPGRVKAFGRKCEPVPYVPPTLKTVEADDGATPKKLPYRDTHGVVHWTTDPDCTWTCALDLIKK